MSVTDIRPDQTERPRTPYAWIVPLPNDLDHALRVYAEQQHKKPKTIIAEALRHYLGLVQ